MSPDFLLPTPAAQESTPTDEFLEEVREHLDTDDPLHRLWLPGRKWMTQRTLSRTVPALVRAGVIVWGVYEPAIRRWEEIIGRSHPAPIDENERLAPAFVEWMLGFPEGWVSDVDIPRAAQLRILGNAVQVQCGERAGEWFGELMTAGVL